MTATTYAILGTGALGGYYGGLLARAGFETHFLLRSDFEHVRDRGLRVDSKDGDFYVPPDRLHAHGDAADLPAVDVAVVGLKTTSNHLLPELLASCVKPDGVVLVLQNGYAPEADAAAVVGAERVLGGLCFLCSNKVGPGHIDHQDYGHVHVGVYQPDVIDSPASQHFCGVVEDFNRAGIETSAVDDLCLSRWKKLIWNIPYNGLSVVLGQTTRSMMDDFITRDRIEATMREVQGAALAVDHKVIVDSFIEQMLDYTDHMKPYKTSMMLDHEAGRPLEFKAIFGDPLRAALVAEAHAGEIESIYRGLLQVEFGSPYAMNSPKVDAYVLLDRAEIRVRQAIGSDPSLVKQHAFWVRRFDSLRNDVANDCLTESSWNGMWRTIADSVAAPERGLFHELMALLQASQNEMDRALADSAWRGD